MVGVRYQSTRVCGTVNQPRCFISARPCTWVPPLSSAVAALHTASQMASTSGTWSVGRRKSQPSPDSGSSAAPLLMRST